jgi:hypothetical protein
MRGPFAVLLASTLLVGTVFSNEAWAQKKRVVVEMFNKGPGPAKVRAAIIRGLLKNGIEVVPDKRVAAIEADLGLIKVSDSYAAVARETKAHAFIGGVVAMGRRPKARAVVRSAEGKPLGAGGWQATNLPRLIAAVNASAGPRLAGIIKGAGAAPPAPAAVAKADADSDPLAEKPGKAEPAEEVAAAEAPADEEPAPRRRPRKGQDAEEGAEETAEGADAEVEAEADEDEDPTPRKRARGQGLNVAFVMRMFSRNFAYNESKKGPQQGYQAPEQKFNGMPLVPMPGLAVEYFPTAYAGGFTSFNYAIVGSKDSEGSVYKTTAYSWLIGAKGRLAVSSLEIEPSIAYGSHVFKITNFKDDIDRIQVAPVDYRHARIGSDVRLPFSKDSAFVAGGHYLHILSAGDILVKEKYFSGAAVGFEASAGVVLPLTFYKGLDLRIGADFRQITFDFSTAPTDERVAGGAIDRYIGLNLGVGFSPGI